MKIDRIRFILLSSIIVLVIASCVKEGEGLETSVVTEQIIFTSGEIGIFSGRIKAEDEISASDHGFEIDTDASFSNPIAISLGARNVPGGFVGETNELIISTEYFCRSYLILPEGVKYGNELEFSTLKPLAFDFEPKEGLENIKITLKGANLTQDTKILWDENVITPNDIVEETFATFNVPPLNNIPVVFPSVVSQGDTIQLSDPFEYIIGVWEEGGFLDDPYEPQRYTYLDYENHIYYGLGISDEAQGLSAKFSKLDKSSLSRTEIPFTGTPVEGSCFCENYFGGGSVNRVKPTDTDLDNTDAFYKYENDAFIELANIPANLYKATAICQQDKVYLFGGEDNDRKARREVYVYDKGTDSWATLSKSPHFPPIYFPAFTIDGKNFLIDSAGINHVHDPLTDSWSTAAPYPVDTKSLGISTVLNDVAYVGLQDAGRRLFAFHYDENRWRQKKLLPNINTFITLGSWVLDDKLFVERIKTGASNERQLWILSPNSF